jgi:hypothetical protein
LVSDLREGEAALFERLKQKCTLNIDKIGTGVRVVFNQIVSIADGQEESRNDTTKMAWLHPQSFWYLLLASSTSALTGTKHVFAKAITRDGLPFSLSPSGKASDPPEQDKRSVFAKDITKGRSDKLCTIFLDPDNKA